jgi:hypothetical protein
MALVERGLHVRGLRIRLILQSEDVETHAFISDNIDYFNMLSEHLQNTAMDELRMSIPERKKL